MHLQLDKKYGGSANTMSIELSSNCSIRDKLTPLYKLKSFAMGKAVTC